MGLIRITLDGSFRKMNGSETFSAIRHGHAQAVSEAITYLSNTVLPEAISLDHKLHNEKVAPSEGFGIPGVSLAREQSEQKGKS